MRTRRRTFLATGLVALLTIAGVTAAIANDPPPRIAFLANGIVPADALAAGPIAGQLGAPIFTTAPDHLVASTATALDAYNPQLVIVMGGPVAISDAVLGQVSSATGLSVVGPNPPPSSGIVRAAGEDRFETAAAAAALLAAYDPAYLPTDMKAVDSDKLDGKDSTAFQPAGNYLGKTEKAADSDKLDGKDSTAFLGKAEKAADANAVDGIDSADLQWPDVLPAGKTMTGTYAIEFVGGANDTGAAEISFPIPLGAPPTPHFIEEGDSAPAECPGSAASPSAAPGHLCVYEFVGTNSTGPTPCLVNNQSSFSCGTAGTHGAGVFLRADVAATARSYGTWAVTSDGTMSASVEVSAPRRTPGGAPDQ